MTPSWTKVSTLGRGRTTTVWQGEADAGGRPVAIKEILPTLAPRGPFVDLYLDEARKMAAVSHPRVLAIHAIDGSTDPPRLIVELADGTARDLLGVGPLRPERAATLLGHALEGLAALHGRGLLHRAIRPENLYRCGDGFKIGDFGIGATTETPELLLSPRYAAPERLARAAARDGDEAPPLPDRRADLYSLGIVLYELLLGTPRFEAIVRDRTHPVPGDTEQSRRAGKDPDLWLRFHRDRHDLPPPRSLAPAVPEPLSSVVGRLARKDPSARYPDADTALRDLFPAPERTLGSRGTPVPPPLPQAPSPAPSNRRPVPPRRWLWAGVLATVLLAGTAGVLYLGPELPGLRFPWTGSRSFDTARSMVDELTDLAGPEHGPRLSTSGHSTSFRYGEPIRFRADPGRAGGLVLFAISSDGSVHRFYPGPGEDRFEVRSQRERLLLPLTEDLEDGYRLVATAPAGWATIFVLTYEDLTAPFPEGRSDPEGWFVTYPFTGPDSPAAGFVRWAAEQRRQRPEETGLAVLELDIRPGGP